MSRASTPLQPVLDWMSVEMLGYTYFSARGYRILVPLVNTSDYDFVAEKDGTFTRVNVKLAGLKNRNRPNGWSISVSSGAGKKLVGGVDTYLAYLPDEGRFIEIPGTFFTGCASKSKLIPPKLLKALAP